MRDTIKKIVIDLETFDTSPRAVIWEIGACVINPDWTRGDTFQCYVDPAGQLERRIDNDTMHWWISNGIFKRFAEIEAQKENGTGSGFLFPSVAAADFSSWLKKEINSVREIEIWANSPRFDCSIARDFLSEFCNRDAPWEYHEERDVRTIKAFMPDMKIVNNHHALPDAENEALLICEFYKRAHEGSLGQNIDPEKLSTVA